MIRLDAIGQILGPASGVFETSRAKERPHLLYRIHSIVPAHDSRIGLLRSMNIETLGPDTHGSRLELAPPRDRTESTSSTQYAACFAEPGGRILKVKQHEDHQHSIHAVRSPDPPKASPD